VGYTSFCAAPSQGNETFIVTQLRFTSAEELLKEDDVQRRTKMVDPTPVTTEKEPGEPFGAAVYSLRYMREQAEIRAIQSALTQTGWNRKRASRLLKISYRGLLYKIRRHDIHPA
jgi:transcriptional regulator with GAF, ATPase, and Fis domain